MERNVDINEISDGKRYQINDMVKIGCSDCEGCFKCCENMDGLITLDPYDIHRLITGLNMGSGERELLLINANSSIDFNTLINKHISFTVDRGLIIPTLMMSKETGKCTFLRENGRCSIHSIRPGICRLFPMGRLYENGSFTYFLQKDECDYPGKTKVKLKNWLDTKEINKYEKYVCDWHYFLRDIQDYIKSAEEEEIRQINSVLIRIFYSSPYGEDFYTDFYERLSRVRELI